MASRLIKSRSDFRLLRARDGEGKDGVEKLGGRGHDGDDQHNEDEDRAKCPIEFPPPYDMDLQVEHGRPDEEGGDHLDGREPPVREEQFDPLEEHGERTDQQGQWCEDPTALAERDDRGLYRVDRLPL